jgi:5-methylcytosine-specific restriction endonuclease McrA
VTQTAAQRRLIRLAASTNKKAAVLGLNGRITAEDYARAYIATEGECPYCGIGITPESCSFDHVVSFAREGLNEPANIVACCLTCQREKSTKSPEEFAQARLLVVACEICGKVFKPRFADWIRGFGRTCSAECAGMKGKRVQMAGRA